MYHIEWPGASRRHFLILSWLLPIATGVLFIMMGRLNTGSTRQMLVTLPFVGLFMPIALLVADAYKLTVYKGAMTRTQYTRSFAQQTGCVIAGLILCALMLIFDVVYLLTVDGAFNRSEGIFLALGCAMAVVFALFYAKKKQIRVTKAQ